MFDQFESRLLLEGTLTATTALRIGVGRATEPVGTDLPVIRDARSYPFIPGSSFKGVLRSRLESFVRAVVPDLRKGACIPTGKDEERCLPANDVKEDDKVKVEGMSTLRRKAADKKWSDKKFADEVWKRSCLICRTFGSPWLASKVQVRDLPVREGDWFGQYQVRDGVAIDRDTGRAAEGFLYDYEVVPAGTSFQLRIIVENAADWQLGMLFAGLGEFEDRRVALGGATSRGLGEVKLDFTKRQLIKQRDLLDYLAGDDGVGEEVTDELIKAWRKAFVEELKRRAKDAQATAK